MARWGLRLHSGANSVVTVWSLARECCAGGCRDVRVSLARSQPATQQVSIGRCWNAQLSIGYKAGTRAPSFSHQQRLNQPSDTTTYSIRHKQHHAHILRRRRRVAWDRTRVCPPVGMSQPIACIQHLQPSSQAGRPDTVVFAIVRNAKGSTHLAAAVAHLKNVHVVEAEIVDHASLEVHYTLFPLSSTS